MNNRTVHLYSYAAEGAFKLEHMRKQQEQLNISAFKEGKISSLYALGIEDIDANFREKNKRILELPRGAGYWLWKYYFALSLLSDPTIAEGDILVYADVKQKFFGDVKYFTDIMDRDKIDFMTFWKPYWSETLLFLEKTWTKRDCFILMGQDEEKYAETMQGWAGFYMYRKCDFTRKFFEEAIKYGQDYRCITDSPNECGKPNYETFLENRWDQSILSLLAKKYHFYPYRYPNLPEGPHTIRPIEIYPNFCPDTKSTFPPILGYQAI